MAHAMQSVRRPSRICSLPGGEGENEFGQENRKHHPSELPQDGFPDIFVGCRDVEMEACPCRKEKIVAKLLQMMSKVPRPSG